MSNSGNSGNAGALDTLFQKNLQDLIKGIRSHKKDLSEYVSQAIAEIKVELRCTDVFMKAEAVRKLTYIQMLGFNVDWASFSIVEVMSQIRFAHKRIGYLAANQIFNESTDVILLTTNLFKKEFTNINSGQYEIGMAINCLANIATKELARDCLSDIVNLMNNSKPYIRKKAILAIYKLYIKYPQGLRLTFDKLKERLDDSEMSVSSTAVNVICELANKNPNNYLGLAPKFFRFLTTSANNWMLIKVVKLLTSLVPEEPRLARKLLDPLANIVQNTGAKSLQYECIYALTECLIYSKRDDGSEAKNVTQIIKLCADHLKEFIMENDQNLKYLGLVGMCNLMKSGNNNSSASVRAVLEHRDIILRCLYDEDMTIRMKSIELLTGFVTKNSLMELVKHFLLHARQTEGIFRDEIISKVLGMCKRDKYSMITDFAWLVNTLLEMATLQSQTCGFGREIAEQLMDIALRVQTLRPYAVEKMLALLFDDNVAVGQARSSISEVFRAAGWILGEYNEVITDISRDSYEPLDDEDDDDEDHHSEDSGENACWILAVDGEEIRSQFRGQHQLHCMVITALLHAKTTQLPSHTQAVFLHASMKVMLRAFHDCDAEEVADIIAVLRTSLPLFLQNSDMEVQERASILRHLLAEMKILPLDWEETLKQQQQQQQDVKDKEKDKNKDSHSLNLLDLMPSYSLHSVRSIDEHGARIAQNHANMLCQSILYEKFYAVHPKAQRKVPVPAELDLDRPVHSSALNKLLDMELCGSDLSLSALRLVKDTFNYSNNAASGGSSSRPAAFYDDDKQQQTNNNNANNNNNNNNENASFASGVTTKQSVEDNQRTNHTTTNNSNSNSSVFMLSSKQPTDMTTMPLSKILGETLDESHSQGQGQGHGHKKKKDKQYSASYDKQRKKSKALQRVQVDVSEALPVIDHSHSHSHGNSRDLLNLEHSNNNTNYMDDDNDHQQQRRKHHQQQTKKRSQQQHDDVNTLEDVDITTPLGANEVLYVPTHRIVPETQQTHTATHTSSKEDREKDSDKQQQQKSKKDKKDKEKDSKSKDKDKDKEKRNKSQSSSKSKSKSDHHEAEDLLNLMDYTTNTNTNTSSKQATTRTASSSGYSIAYEHPALMVSYQVSCSAKDDDVLEVTIKWRATSSHASIRSVQLLLQGQGQSLHPAVIPSSVPAMITLLPVDSSSGSGSGTVKSKLLLQRQSTAAGGLDVSGQLVINNTPTANNLIVHLSALSFCKASKMDKTEFIEKVTNNKLCKAAASTALPLTSVDQQQQVWTLLADALHVHVVEVERTSTGQAATLASKSLLLPSTYLLYLAKLKPSTNGSMSVVLDIKVISKKGDASDCQRLVNATVENMRDVTL